MCNVQIIKQEVIRPVLSHHQRTRERERHKIEEEKRHYMGDISIEGFHEFSQIVNVLKMEILHNTTMATTTTTRSADLDCDIERYRTALRSLTDVTDVVY